MSVSSPPGSAGCQDQRTKIANNCCHIAILFRKGGLLLNNILVVIGAVLMGTAKAAGSYHMLILGRCNVTLTSPIGTITTLTIIVTN